MDFVNARNETAIDEQDIIDRLHIITRVYHNTRDMFNEVWYVLEAN